LGLLTAATAKRHVTTELEKSKALSPSNLKLLFDSIPPARLERDAIAYLGPFGRKAPALEVVLVKDMANVLNSCEDKTELALCLHLLGLNYKSALFKSSKLFDPYGILSAEMDNEIVLFPCEMEAYYGMGFLNLARNSRIGNFEYLALYDAYCRRAESHDFLAAKNIIARYPTSMTHANAISRLQNDCEDLSPRAMAAVFLNYFSPVGDGFSRYGGNRDRTLAPTLSYEIQKGLHPKSRAPILQSDDTPIALMQSVAPQPELPVYQEPPKGKGPVFAEEHAPKKGSMVKFMLPASISEFTLVTELKLATSVQRALLRNGIKTVEQLANMDEKAIASIFYLYEEDEIEYTRSAVDIVRRTLQANATEYISLKISLSNNITTDKQAATVLPKALAARLASYGITKVSQIADDNICSWLLDAVANKDSVAEALNMEKIIRLIRSRIPGITAAFKHKLADEKAARTAPQTRLEQHAETIPEQDPKGPLNPLKRMFPNFDMSVYSIVQKNTPMPFFGVSVAHQKAFARAGITTAGELSLLTKDQLSLLKDYLFLTDAGVEALRRASAELYTKFQQDRLDEKENSYIPKTPDYGAVTHDTLISALGLTLSCEKALTDVGVHTAFDLAQLKDSAIQTLRLFRRGDEIAEEAKKASSSLQELFNAYKASLNKPVAEPVQPKAAPIKPPEEPPKPARKTEEIVPLKKFTKKQPDKTFDAQPETHVSTIGLQIKDILLLRNCDVRTVAELAAISKSQIAIVRANKSAIEADDVLDWKYVAMNILRKKELGYEPISPDTKLENIPGLGFPLAALAQMGVTTAFDLAYSPRMEKIATYVLSVKIRKEIVSASGSMRNLLQAMRDDEEKAAKKAKEPDFTDKVLREKAIQEQAAAKEREAKEQAAKEQAEKEQAAKELAAKAQAEIEQAAKDQAAKDQAAKPRAESIAQPIVRSQASKIGPLQLRALSKANPDTPIGELGFSLYCMATLRSNGIKTAEPLAAMWDGLLPVFNKYSTSIKDEMSRAAKYLHEMFADKAVSDASAEVKPIEVAPVKPIEDAPAKPVEVAPEKPIEVAQTKPVETPPAKPIEVAQTKPVETPPTKPVEVAQAKPIEVAPPKPAAPDPEALAKAEEVRLMVERMECPVSLLLKTLRMTTPFAELENMKIRELSTARSALQQEGMKLIKLAGTDIRGKLLAQIDEMLEIEEKFSARALEASIDWIKSGNEIKSFSFVYSFCDRMKVKIKRLEFDPLLAVCYHYGKTGLITFEEVRDYFKPAKHGDAFLALATSVQLSDAFSLSYDSARKVFLEEELSIVQSLPSFIEDEKAALENAGIKAKPQALQNAFKRLYKKGKDVLYKLKAKPEELCEYAIGKWPDGWLTLEDFGKFRIFAEGLVYKDILLPSSDQALWDMLSPYSMIHEGMLVFKNSIRSADLKRLCNEMKSWGNFVLLENAQKKAKKMFVGPLAESKEMLAKALEEHAGAQVVGGYICFEPLGALSKRAEAFVAKKVIATEEELMQEFKEFPREVLDGALTGAAFVKKNGCFASGDLAGSLGNEIARNIKQLASIAPVNKEALAEHLTLAYPKFALQKGLSGCDKIMAAVCFAFDGFKINGDCLEIEGLEERRNVMAVAFDD
jgi:hypothetical protein